MQFKSNTILINEFIHALNINPSGLYIDGTFGCGGHSKVILSKLNKYGKLIAFDRDPMSVSLGSKIQDNRFKIFHSKFSSIRNHIEKLNLMGLINGIILDLGMSYLQLDNPDRGFSFRKNGPLDMRMDNTIGKPASEWLSKASIKEISYVLKKFGEEKFYQRISKNIYSTNKKNKIKNTFELVKIILRSIPKKKNRKKHPATKTFQAIRIYINEEIEEIKNILNNIIEMLAPGGRMVVISFHSLEDRLIKRFIANYISKNISSKNKKYIMRSFGKVKPSKLEMQNNPRSKSAILRFAEKI